MMEKIISAVLLVLLLVALANEAGKAIDREAAFRGELSRANAEAAQNARSRERVAAYVCQEAMTDGCLAYYDGME